MTSFSLAGTDSWPFPLTVVYKSLGLVAFICLPLCMSRACCTCYPWVTLKTKGEAPSIMLSKVNVDISPGSWQQNKKLMFRCSLLKAFTYQGDDNINPNPFNTVLFWSHCWGTSTFLIQVSHLLKKKKRKKLPNRYQNILKNLLWPCVGLLNSGVRNSFRWSVWEITVPDMLSFSK